MNLNPLRRSLLWTVASVLLIIALCGDETKAQSSKIPVVQDCTAVIGDLHSGADFLTVELKQGQTLQLDVREEHLEASVGLFSQPEKQLIKLSDFGSGYDRETLTYLAEQAGTYLIVVVTPTPQLKGSYLLITYIKETTATERLRFKAEQLLAEGLAKRSEKPPNLIEAVANLEESLLSWKKLGDPYWEGFTLYHIGAVYEKLKEKDKALDCYIQALPLVEQAQAPHVKAVVLNSMGLIYSELGERAKTLDCYSQALILNRQVGNLSDEVNVLHNLGMVYSALDDHTKALDYYNQALTGYKELEDRDGEANCLLGLGEVYADLGAKTKAIDYFGQAAKIGKDIEDLSRKATALHKIAEAYFDLGDGLKAINFFNEALEIFKKLGDPRDIANTLNGLGWVFSSLGDKAIALEYFNQALSFLKNVDDLRIEGSMLVSIGIFYRELGENAKALDYFKQALPRFKQTREQKYEALTLYLIATTYNSLNRYEEALDYLKRSLTLFKNLRNKNREAEILDLIGIAYSSLGDKAAADRYNTAALVIFEDLAHEGNSALALKEIGYLYFLIGEKQKSLDYLSRALSYSRYRGAGNNEPFVLGILSMWWELSGNRRMAIFYLKLSVNKYQKKRDELQGIESELQKSFLREHQSSYKHLAQLLIEEGQTEQAVQVLNLYQDQRFFDFNRDANSPNKKVDLTPREQALAARYEATLARLGEIGLKIKELEQQSFGRQLNEQESAQMRMLKAELESTTNAFLEVLKSAEMELAKPPDGKDKIAAIQDVVEMQSALRELSAAIKQKTFALYTLISEDKFYIILLTPDGEVKPFEAAIKADDLNKKLVEFYALLQSPTYDPRPLGQDLYRIIFKPVEASLKKAGAQTLIWQLDANLRYVPMAALFDGKQYLVERYQNVVLTRSETKRMLQAVKSNWTGTGFASSQEQTIDLLGDGTKTTFPALPGVISELQSIFRASAQGSGILNGTVLTDKQFTKQAFYTAMKQGRPLVHISSHFAFRPGDDSRSFLLLGDGSTLTLNEMKKQEKLFDGVELLTLSACNTAATQPDANGKEIDGFAELAQRLGADAVMATLWQVSDNSTPWLMREFYATRQSHNGRTKAEALRNAQLALLNGTAVTQSLFDAVKSGMTANFKLEIIPNGTRRPQSNNRAEIVYVEARNAPPFKFNEKKPFAHPYYWSPFVLFGNAR